MKTKEIKELLNILKEEGLTELSYKDETFSITLKKETLTSGITIPQQSVTAPITEAVKDGIKAPLVGVFYDKPSPDASVFVTQGQAFKKGDVLCIIEAMKVMNEIKADRDGVVARVCVEDGQAVSFDEVLFELQ